MRNGNHGATGFFVSLWGMADNKKKVLSDDRIRTLYEGDYAGGLGVRKFITKLKKDNYAVTAKQVIAAVDKLESEAITTATRVTKAQTYPVWANEDQQFMADLAFMPQPANRNGGHKALLTLVNMNTRKAIAVPLKSKKAADVNSEMARVMGAVIKETKMTTLETDRGSEFTSKAMKALYDQEGVTHVTMTSSVKHHALGMIERFNRTLKKMLATMMIRRGTPNQWYRHLDAVVKAYNSSPHSGNIDDAAPNEVTRNNILRQRIIKRNKAYGILYDDDIDVGDGVRIRAQKKTFGKEQAPFSKEVYNVDAIQGLGYRLRNPKGDLLREKFMPYELKLVKNNVPIKRVTRGKTQAVKEVDDAKRTRQTKKAQKELQDTLPRRTGKRKPKPNPKYA